MTKRELRWKDAAADCPRGLAEALQLWGSERASTGELHELRARTAALRARPLARPLGVRPGVWGAARWLALAAVGIGLGAFALRTSGPHAPALARTLELQARDSRPQAAEPAGLRSAAPATPATDSSVAGAPTQIAPRAEPAAQAPRFVAVAEPRMRRARPGRAALDEDPEAELRLLARAQAELHRAPQLAAAALAEHARSHPHGVFVQERELLRIELAVVQGDAAQVRALARTFAARYPRSTYQRRIRSLLDADSGEAPREDRARRDTHLQTPN